MSALVGETPEWRTGGGEVPDQRRIGNSRCPTAPEITTPQHLLKTLLIERLQLPRQLTAAACQDARFFCTSWASTGVRAHGPAGNSDEPHPPSARTSSFQHGIQAPSNLCSKSAMLQQETDLEHLVQTELVNRLPTTRHKSTVVLQSSSKRRCAWWLVSLFTLRRRHFDENTRTLNQNIHEFRCVATPTPRSRRPKKMWKIGKAPNLWRPSKALLSDFWRHFRVLAFLHWTLRSSIASRSLRGPIAGWQISMPNVRPGGRVAKRCSGDPGVNGMQGEKCDRALSGRSNLFCGRGPKSPSQLKESCHCFVFEGIGEKYASMLKVTKRKAENWR